MQALATTEEPLSAYDPGDHGRFLDVYCSEGSTGSRTSEERLLFAALQDAINRFLRTGNADDKEWLDSDREDIFSYLGICDELGINCPERLRRALLAKRRRREKSTRYLHRFLGNTERKIDSSRRVR